VKPLPLILDSRVKNFLRYLSRENGQEFWGKLSFSKAEEYVQFVYTIDSWAKSFNVYQITLNTLCLKRENSTKNNTNNRKRGKEMDVGSERLPTDQH